MNRGGGVSTDVDKDVQKKLFSCEYFPHSIRQLAT